MQALILYWLPVVLFDPPTSLRDVLHDGFNRGYTPYALTAVLGISASQLTLLLPVMKPRLRKRSGRPRMILRHMVTGVAMGWCVAVTVTMITAILADYFGDRSWSIAINVYWITLAVAATLCTLASWRFAPRRTPMLPSIICAAGAGVAMAVSLALALLSLVQLLMGERLSPALWTFTIVITIVGAWAIATPMLALVLYRGRRTERLSRTAAWLVAGSALEALLILPIDIMIRRKTDCYCEEGTYFAWIVLSGAGLFAFGPMLLLAPMARRRRRRRARQCLACGYDLRSTPHVRNCPECGTPTRRRDIASTAD